MSCKMTMGDGQVGTGQQAPGVKGRQPALAGKQIVLLVFKVTCKVGEEFRQEGLLGEEAACHAGVIPAKPHRPRSGVPAVSRRVPR